MYIFAIVSSVDNHTAVVSTSSIARVRTFDTSITNKSSVLTGQEQQVWGGVKSANVSDCYTVHETGCQKLGSKKLAVFSTVGFSPLFPAIFTILDSEPCLSLKFLPFEMPLLIGDYIVSRDWCVSHYPLPSTHEPADLKVLTHYSRQIFFVGILTSNF